MRSLTGAILFGSSGDGVRARLKFDTATPMMKIIEEAQQDRVKKSTFILANTQGTIQSRKWHCVIEFVKEQPAFICCSATEKKNVEHVLWALHLLKDFARMVY